jgi:tetratricopeptide (TPR) repeat protein
LGQYEAALEVARGDSSDPYPLEYRHQLALNLIFERRFDAALLEAGKMLERAPGYASALMVKGDVHFYRSEWDQAEAYYRELLSPVGSEQGRLRFRFDGFRRLAGLYLARGQTEQALDCINQAIHEVETLGERQWLVAFQFKRAFIFLTQGNLSETAAEVEILLAEAERRNSVVGKLAALEIRGMTNLETGDTREAKRIADEMKKEIEGWLNPKLMRRWHFFVGHILLAEEDVGGAAAHFEKAVAMLPYQHEPIGDAHAWYYSALADAYYLSGELDKAQEWYENFQALTTGRLGAGATYAKSHFMLGQIYEQRGMNAKAIRSYRTFLDLWREADLKAPELEEAKRTLAALLE